MLEYQNRITILLITETFHPIPLNANIPLIKRSTKYYGVTSILVGLVYDIRKMLVIEEISQKRIVHRNGFLG